MRNRKVCCTTEGLFLLRNRGPMLRSRKPLSCATGGLSVARHDFTEARVEKKTHTRTCPHVLRGRGMDLLCCRCHLDLDSQRSEAYISQRTPFLKLSRRFQTVKSIYIHRRTHHCSSSQEDPTLFCCVQALSLIHISEPTRPY